MAKLSIEEVTRIASLARIGLVGEELTSLSTQLSSILNFVDQLQTVDTTNIEPTSQVTGLVDVMREDVVRPCEISRQELLANAPATENDYIKVKRIIA